MEVLSTETKKTDVFKSFSCLNTSVINLFLPFFKSAAKKNSAAGFFYSVLKMLTVCTRFFAFAESSSDIAASCSEELAFCCTTVSSWIIA